MRQGNARAVQCACMHDHCGIATYNQT